MDTKLAWQRGGEWHMDSKPIGYRISKAMLSGVPIYTGWHVYQKTPKIIAIADDINTVKNEVEKYAQQNNPEGLSAG
jgi:hypothetical protein